MYWNDVLWRCITRYWISSLYSDLNSLSNIFWQHFAKIETSYWRLEKCLGKTDRWCFWNYSSLLRVSISWEFNKELLLSDIYDSTFFLVSMQTPLSPDKVFALPKINFQQKCNVLLCAVWKYQTDYANADLGELSFELDLETNLNISHNGISERFR